MSDADDRDDVESIRERKRERLREELADEGGAGGSGTPTDPVHIEGAGHMEQFVTDHDVVLVDFYADWCGPCKMLEPTVEEIAAETGAAVAKVDIDAHQDLAAQYRVQGVPTLHLFADGEPAEQMVGVQEKATLENLVAQYA
jgi:thioredoxin 1